MALTKITWADKTALNPQPSVARENKCTDDDLNEIKSVVNTNVDKVGDLTDLDTTDKLSVVNAINELHGNYEYSTTEVNTHKKWIDGKDIYRIVLNLDTIPASPINTSIDVASLNVDTPITTIGLFTKRNKGTIDIGNYYSSSNDYGRIFYREQDGLYTIQIRMATTDSPINSIKVIFEYTKAS